MDTPFLRIERITTDQDPIVADGVIRDAVLPALAAMAGLRGAWAGRRGIQPAAERVLATAWDAEADGRPAADLLCRLVGVGASDARIAAPIVLCERFARPSPARVLRIYEGITRAGELDAYLEEARAGILVDGASPDGPHSVCMGVVGSDRFVTVSTWTDWECLARCTGGDIQRPLATRNAARLIGGGPTHLELLAAE